MDGRFNTIAGWVLGAGIVLLGSSLVTREVFKAERPETMGYPIAGVVEDDHGGEAEQPIAFYLQTADAARGQAVFARCTACHTVSDGGPDGLGPNLWATMGGRLAHRPAFAYSDALRNHGGNWGWEEMSAWLQSPRTFAAGTKMTFAGLSNPQDRADVMLFLNQHGGTLTVPPPPAAAPAGGNEADGNADGANEADANAAAPGNDIGSRGGPAAPDVSGRAAQERPAH